MEGLSSSEQSKKGAAVKEKRVDSRPRQNSEKRNKPDVDDEGAAPAKKKPNNSDKAVTNTRKDEGVRKCKECKKQFSSSKPGKKLCPSCRKTHCVCPNCRISIERFLITKCGCHTTMCTECVGHCEICNASLCRDCRSPENRKLCDDCAYDTRTLW